LNDVKPHAALQAEAGSMIEDPSLVYVKLKSPRHEYRNAACRARAEEE
jgi:hypothetical protein